MTNEMIISESQSLYSDIDCCITELLKARTEHNSENEGKALFKMESLMVSTLQHLACIIEQPSLPNNLDEAAEGYIQTLCDRADDNLRIDTTLQSAFKAGAEWYGNQMKMPSSSELISAWRGVRAILQEKDFRGDEWRLAYNAFMFGFSKGLNTQTKKK